MIVHLKHWLLQSFALRRCREEDAQIIIVGITQQRTRSYRINKERCKMFSEKLYDFKWFWGKIP